MQRILLAAGCFWCVEGKFKTHEAVTSTLVGYSGGNTKNPNYQEVCTGRTNHAEVILIEFDDSKANLAEILDFFFTIHDPTTLNRQGLDIGTQYRSGIYFYNEEQKQIALESIQKNQVHFLKPIVTEVQEAQFFYKAEEYHQNYHAKKLFHP